MADEKVADIEDVDDLAPGEVCVICTGSQGEPMSALTRLSQSENRFLKLTPHDTIILSSHPIPGNEHDVWHMVLLLPTVVPVVLRLQADMIDKAAARLLLHQK